MERESDNVKAVLSFFCSKKTIEVGRGALELLEEIEKLYNESQFDLVDVISKSSLDKGTKELLINIIVGKNQFTGAKKQIYRKRILDIANEASRSIKEEINKYNVLI